MGQGDQHMKKELGDETPPLQGLLKKRIKSAQKMLILQRQDGEARTE